MDHGNAPTLDSGTATLKAAVAELPGPQLEDLVRLDRYSPGALIGKGGMGEVRQCHDVRLNRNIALKSATTRNKAELSRFVREAQVQGQLEHPSIVPVYELGVGSDGAPYFAMKRVRGESLYDVLSALSKGDAEHRARYPRRRLLQAFLSVCQAVDYAHVNGWIHRDLKPANIMLGDFGEVYVLDWGLARKVDAKDEETSEGTMALAPIGLTTPGSLMGTPGYMSPEQVQGARAEVRSDVYALGAILFEVLTQEMLAKGTTTMELLINTRDGCDTRARIRAPHADVPPELEAIVQKAAAKEAKHRFATVRELHDSVDRVLAGERDLELRSGLAKQHAEAAAAARAKADTDPKNELEHRKSALREVGLALALDPGHRPAMATLVELMQSVPKTIPPETREELAVVEGNSVRRASRAAFAGFFAAFLMVVTMMFFTVNGYIIGCAALFLLAAISAGHAGYMSRRPKSLHALPSLILSNLAIMSLFFLDGPVTALPAFSAVNTLAFRNAMGRPWRWLVVGLGVFTAVAPLLASMAGLLPESIRFVDGGIMLLPIALQFSAQHTPFMLVSGFMGTIAFAAYVVGSVRDSAVELAGTRAMQSWNLAQLLPPEAAPKPRELEMPVEGACPITRAVESEPVEAAR